MKKLNKKKIVYLVILIGIIVFLLGLYNAFNGNPISKAISKVKVEKYIEETYPDKDFKIDEVVYNFKFGTYYAVVSSEKEGYLFNIEIMGKDNIWDAYKESPMLIDIELTNRFSNTIIEYTKEDIGDVVKLLDDNNKEKNYNYLFAEIEVPQGKYRDKNIQFSNGMDDPFVLNLSLYPENGDNYKDELLLAAKALRSSINKRNYNGIIGMFVNIGWENTSYCIVLEKEELNINDDELVNYIQEGNASYTGVYGNYKIEVFQYDK